MISRLALILAAFGAALVPLPPSLVETWYSRRVYLSLERALVPLSNRVPFALFDALLGIVALWLLVTVVRLAGGWRKRGILGSLAVLLLRVAAVAAVVYLAFVAAWGLNYRRIPLPLKLSFSREKVTEAAALGLAKRTAARANQLKASAAGGAAWNDVPRLLDPSFQRVQQQLAPVVPAVPARPKQTLLAGWFERSGVDGMTDPFFLETLVNPGVLPFERPFITAHEWAHLAGYADESEANFIGWLVCLQGPPPAEYSAHIALLWQVLPALSRDDRAATLKLLSAGVREDLAAVQARVAKATPLLRDASWKVYDKYLKANRVEKGIRSYDAALELLLGTTFRPGWVPVTKQ